MQAQAETIGAPNVVNAAPQPVEEDLAAGRDDDAEPKDDDDLFGSRFEVNDVDEALPVGG